MGEGVPVVFQQQAVHQLRKLARHDLSEQLFRRFLLVPFIGALHLHQHKERGDNEAQHTAQHRNSRDHKTRIFHPRSPRSFAVQAPFGAAGLRCRYSRSRRSSSVIWQPGQITGWPLLSSGSAEICDGVALPSKLPADNRRGEVGVSDRAVGPGAIERPALGNEPGDYWGSDAVALMLRELDIPYVALNPGASYRGLHDSLVNLLGNRDPQMLLCLHEEHAVAMAHGYAKVTGRPMGAIVHSNVGLMHATMAIFNAWCDRTPVVVLGATGPVDAAKRRPWIDWIHTAQDQGALVRHYTKWDDQPASPAAAREALLRGWWLSNAEPKGPVYINLDAEMQEARLPEPLPPIDIHRFVPQMD